MDILHRIERVSALVQFARVRLLIATLVAVGVTASWLTAVATTIDYQQAVDDSFYLWGATTLMLIIVRRIYYVNIEDMRARSQVAIVLLSVVAGFVVIHWLSTVLPTAHVTNMMKFNVTIVLPIVTGMLIWRVTSQVYRNEQRQRELETRANDPPLEPYLR